MDEELAELTAEDIKAIRKRQRDEKYYSAIVVGASIPMSLYIFISPLLNLQKDLAPYMPKIIGLSILLSLLYQHYRLNFKDD